MDEHLAHTPWRVVHTDPFMPQPFVARLALDGFEERPTVIQMQLEGDVRALCSTTLTPVRSEKDWRTLASLVRQDHAEGARTGGSVDLPEVTAGTVASYRAKEGPYRFHLAWEDGQAVAYSALALAPSGAGMIEDLFTAPPFRRERPVSGFLRPA